jgi:magnesium transporter
MTSALPEPAAGLLAEDLRDAWPFLDGQERVEGFRLLEASEAENLFHSLDSRDQSALLLLMREPERQLWLRQLAPDDAADLIQAGPLE